MINNRNVRLMTRLAVYEETDGVKDAETNRFFRADYISSQMLRTFVTTTIAFAILCGVYAIYNFEDMMLNIYSMNLEAFVRQLLNDYIVALVIFEVITFAVYFQRHRQARKHLSEYYKNLKRLEERYRRVR